MEVTKDSVDASVDITKASVEFTSMVSLKLLP